MAINQEKFKQQWSKIIAKCWSDENFKQKLIKNPEQVLKSEGIEVPSGSKIQIHENTENTYHIVLPLQPSENLSEEELKAYAGGFPTCAFCHDACGIH